MLKPADIDWSSLKIEKPRHNSPVCDAYLTAGNTKDGRELTEDELFDVEGMEEFCAFAENAFHVEPEKWD